MTKVLQTTPCCSPNLSIAPLSKLAIEPIKPFEICASKLTGMKKTLMIAKAIFFIVFTLGLALFSKEIRANLTGHTWQVLHNPSKKEQHEAAGKKEAAVEFQKLSPLSQSDQNFFSSSSKFFLFPYQLVIHQFFTSIPIHLPTKPLSSERRVIRFSAALPQFSSLMKKLIEVFKKKAIESASKPILSLKDKKSLLKIKDLSTHFFSVSLRHSEKSPLEKTVITMGYNEHCMEFACSISSIFKKWAIFPSRLGFRLQDAESGKGYLLPASISPPKDLADIPFALFYLKSTKTQISNSIYQDEREPASVAWTFKPGKTYRVSYNIQGMTPISLKILYKQVRLSDISWADLCSG